MDIIISLHLLTPFSIVWHSNAAISISFSNDHDLFMVLEAILAVCTTFKGLCQSVNALSCENERSDLCFTHPGPAHSESNLSYALLDAPCSYFGVLFLLACLQMSYIVI